MGDRFAGLLGVGGMILFFAFGILQLAAGWAGIEDSFGYGWDIAAAAAAIFFRFTLPIVFGAYLCAVNIWGWPWFLALLFAAPGLIFMIPGFVFALAGTARKS